MALAEEEQNQCVSSRGHIGYPIFYVLIPMHTIVLLSDKHMFWWYTCPR